MPFHLPSLPFGLTRLYLMFPATTKERGLLLQPSPKYSRDANKSTYLPYFKRFPHQKFHSQEKRRHEEPAVVAPRRFFTEEKEQPEPTQQQFSSFAIKERSPGKLRPRTTASTQDSSGSYTNASRIRPNASPNTPWLNVLSLGWSSILPSTCTRAPISHPHSC
jgi:hypothetical protein